MSTEVGRIISKVVESGQLVRSMDHDARSRSRTCPGCHEALSRVALIKLAYVFTGCDCGKPEYEHLYEQLWHQSCFAISVVAPEPSDD